MVNLRSTITQILILFVLPFVAHAKGRLLTLTENTWTDLLEGEWMVEFFAPWCPACKQLEPLWKEFSEWGDDLGIKVANIDVTLNPGLSGRFLVTALPTIYHVKDGVFRQYRGARDKDSFFSFIEEKKWVNIDPISSWKTPQSIQMAIVSSFFKLSMGLRAVHTSLVEDYGIPYWGSYIIFGLATVLIGAFLGLIIVCIIDFICPTKPSAYQPVSQTGSTTTEDTKTDDGDFEEEDVIKDDVPPGDQEIRRRNVGDDEGAGDK